MGGLLSEVCCRRIGQANTEWYQHFLPRSISIYKWRQDVNQLKGEKEWREKEKERSMHLEILKTNGTHRQLILVCPDSAALSLLYHLFDVHQHRQSHTTWCKAGEKDIHETTEKEIKMIRIFLEVARFLKGSQRWGLVWCSWFSNLTLSGDSTERPSKAQASLVKMLQISAHWFVSSRLRYGEFSMPWRR